MIDQKELDVFLEHHGVKGQKWGRRKDRSNHGLNARARKLQTVADRRPTRGNIRTAQRAEKSSKYFAPTTKEERGKIRRSASGREGGRIIAKIALSVGAGVGAAHFVRKVLRRNGADPLATAIAGMSTAYVGSAFAGHLLDVNGSRKAKRLVRRAGNAP